MKKNYSQTLKAIITLIVIICTTTGLHSQDKRINFYAGCSAFSDLGRTPVYTKDYVRQTTGGNTNYKFYSKTNFLSIYSASISCSAKLKELSKYSALSFNTGLSLGLIVTSDKSLNINSAYNQSDLFYINTFEDGMSRLKINFPMYLSIDYGLRSESQIDKRFGVSFGLGAEVNKIPFFNIFSFLMIEKPRMTSFWVQPIGVLKFSFLTPGNSLYKICFSGGMGKSLDYPITGSGYYEMDELENNMTECRPFTLIMAVEIPLNF